MILIIISIVTGLIGALFLLKGIFSVLGNPLRGLATSCGGCCLLALGAALLGIAVNLTTYSRLTNETKVAELHFSKIAPQQYQVAAYFPDSHKWQDYILNGDEWQLDAKVIKWHAWANLLGFDTEYKLDRLSGRYRNLAQAQNARPSLHGLGDESGIEIWAWSQEMPILQKAIDAYYGNAAYLPMADKANFDVYISQSGLIARPSNSAGTQAVSNSF